jgi:hypothetical protein
MPPIGGGVAAVNATANGLSGAYNVVANNSVTFALTNVPVSSLGNLSESAWTVNQPGFSGTINISGGTGNFTNLSVSGLPAGLSAALSGTTITLSGTPTQTGVFNSVNVSVVDTGVTVQRTYAININAALGLGTFSPTVWTIHQSSSSSVVITGGTGPFSLGTVTGLPAGANIALSGATITISGTPTQVGVNTIGIQIQDASGAILNAGVGLTVEYPPPTLQPVTSPVTFQRTGPYPSIHLIGGDTEPADIPNLVYSARVLVDNGAYQASQLTQTYGLFNPGQNYYFNTRAIGEKYLQGAATSWFFILPNGAFYEWGGTLASSTLLTTLPNSYWIDPSTILSAVPTDVSATYTTISGNGTSAGQLNVIPSAIQTFAGTLHVQAAVTDGVNSATQSFDVVVSTVPPTLQPITGPITFAHSGPYPSIALIGGDDVLDLPNLVYSAKVYQDIPYQAVQARQTYGLTNPGNNFYFNIRGQNESYFVGTGGTWYFILPSGALYQWGGSPASSTLLANLDSSFGANPNLLLTTTLQDFSPTYTTISGNGTTNGALAFNLGVQSYIGTLDVIASVTDGIGTTTQAFSINVLDKLSLQPITSPVSFPHNGPYPTIDLNGSDDASDIPHLVYSAKVYQDAPYQAVQFRQSLGLTNPGSNFYFNAHGQQESYFAGTGGMWYFILPSGALYQWGGSVASSTLVANLDSSFGANPNLVLTTTLQDVSSVYVTVSGNGTTSGALDFKPAAMQNFVGTLHVVASVTDGTDTAAQSFVVNDTDSLGLQPIGSPVTFPHGGPLPVVILNATADTSDTPNLTYTVKVYQDAPYQAVRLRQAFSLTSPGNNYYFNARGLGESYFLGAGGTWYVILPTGALYQWGGNLASSTLLANLGSAFGNNPSLVLTTTLQDVSPTFVALGGNGTTSGMIEFNPVAMQYFVGALHVQATVSDGVLAATQSFDVTVTDGLSLQSMASPLTVAHNGTLPTITLNAGADVSDTANLVYSAKVYQDTPAYQAYTLRQTYGLLNPGANYYFNTHGQNEKYLIDPSNHWYFILPTGAVYQWGGSVASSTLLGTLNSSFWSSPDLLWNAQAPADAATAYAVQQNYALTNPGRSDFYFNTRGMNEKYFLGAGNNWYFMLPNGGVYLWGGSFAGSTLLATLNTAVYNDLNLLLNAQALPDVSAAYTQPPSGNGTTTGQLNLNAAAINAFNHGKLHFLAAVSDGVVTTTQAFDLIVF